MESSQKIDAIPVVFDENNNESVAEVKLIDPGADAGGLLRDLPEKKVIEKSTRFLLCLHFHSLPPSPG